MIMKDIAKAIRPGTKENELVAIANDRLFRMGSERVECVNSVSGRRGRPHSHTFSDRMIQPGDMILLFTCNQIVEPADRRITRCIQTCRCLTE